MAAWNRLLQSCRSPRVVRRAAALGLVLGVAGPPGAQAETLPGALATSRSVSERSGAARPRAALAMQQDPDGAPEARRVLRLEGGRTVRGRTRRVSGSWELHSEGRWAPVEGAVLEATLESRLLARARDLQRGLDEHPIGGAAHAELVRWLVRSGLRAEAEAEAARALAEAPDDARLLAVLERSGLLDAEAPRSVADQRRLLRDGAGRDALERERAARGLALLEPHEQFPALLGSILGSPSARERALGHLLARRLETPPAWRSVLRASLLDPVEDVRCEATRGLAVRGEPRLLGPLLQGLESSRSLLRRNAAQALGVFGHPAAVEPLVGALEASAGRAGQRATFSSLTQRAILFDFDVEVAAGAVAADPSVVPVTEGVVLDVRILSSEEVVVDDGRAIRRALARLTDGRERTTRGWLGWWREHGSAWRAAERLPAPEGPSTQGEAGAGTSPGIRRHPGTGDQG